MVQFTNREIGVLMLWIALSNDTKYEYQVLSVPTLSLTVGTQVLI